jgi:VanZ family protein
MAKRAAEVALWLYTVLLLLATHWPPDDLPRTTWPLADKAVHLVLYAIWGLLAGLAFRRWRRGLLLGLALGLLDDLTQPFFARSADWRDWCTDAVGLLVGLGAAGLARRWRPSASDPAAKAGIRPVIRCHRDSH